MANSGLMILAAVGAAFFLINRQGSAGPTPDPDPVELSVTPQTVSIGQPVTLSIIDNLGDVTSIVYQVTDPNGGLQQAGGGASGSYTPALSGIHTAGVFGQSASLGSVSASVTFDVT